MAEHADRLVWLDLGDHQVIETTNLGGASIMAIGEAAIGRIVRASDTALFESAPLCVPPDVATTVADAPTAWVDALAEGCRSEWGEVLGGFIAKMHHFDLLCDLPVSVRRQLVQPLDPDLRPDHVGTGGNGSDYDTALVLAAALLEPGTAETLAPLLVASDAPVLHDWAAVMSAPADILCRRLADGLAAVA